jgi:hypothetical protein
MKLATCAAYLQFAQSVFNSFCSYYQTGSSTYCIEVGFVVRMPQAETREGRMLMLYLQDYDPNTKGAFLFFL